MPNPMLFSINISKKACLKKALKNSLFIPLFEKLISISVFHSIEWLPRVGNLNTLLFKLFKYFQIHLLELIKIRFATGRRLVNRGFKFGRSKIRVSFNRSEPL